MEKYKPLVKQGKDTYMQKLESIRWFENPFSSRQKVEEMLNDSVETFYVFALSHIIFDAKGFNSADAYKYLMHDLIKFIPEAEYSILNKSIGAKLSISINKRNYNYLLSFEDDCFDQDLVIEFLNEILAKETIAYRFFLLPSNMESTSLVFIKKEKYQKAIKIGLIPQETGNLFN